MKRLLILLFFIVQLANAQFATFNVTILTSDDNTADNELYFKIYNDPDGPGALKPVLHHTTGTALADPNVSITGSSLTITNVPFIYGTQYYFTISSVDGDGIETIQYSNINFTKTADIINPTLSNFRVTSANPDRVYFDSDTYINTNGFTGFTISGKTITAITNTFDGVDNYLTVSSPFTFWDNNTIRYTTVANEVEDNAGNDLLSFTLEYIQNQIPEPSASVKTIYVDAGATGANNGTSAVDAYTTIAAAMPDAVAGTTIHIKAGNYGAESFLTLAQGGTETQPIKIIGYKNTPGDITTKYYSYGGGALNATEMPLLQNDNTNSDYAFYLHDQFSQPANNYVIIRYLQFEGYLKPVYSREVIGTIVENSIFLNNRGSSNSGRGIDFYQIDTLNSTYVVGKHRAINNLVINSGNTGIGNWSSGSLIKDNDVYCDNTVSHAEATDYYIDIQGSNSIIKGNYTERVTNTVAHGGFGQTVKKDSSSPSLLSEHNLIEDAVSKGMEEGFMARNEGSNYNVWKNSEAYGFGAVKADDTFGISTRGGASFNVFENIYVHDVSSFFEFLQGTEDDVNTNFTGEGNEVWNPILHNAYYFVRMKNLAYSSNNSNIWTFQNNKIINPTIVGVTGYFSRTFDPYANYSFSGNEIVNAIMVDVAALNDPSNDWGFETNTGGYAFNVDTSNLFNVTGITWQTNSISTDPLFNNTTDDTGFVPAATGLNIGLNLLKYDYDKVQRRTDGTTKIGAKEGN